MINLKLGHHHKLSFATAEIELLKSISAAVTEVYVLWLSSAFVAECWECHLDAIWMSTTLQEQWGCCRETRTRARWRCNSESASVISGAWIPALQIGHANRCHAGGLQRATTTAQDRYLMTSTVRNRSANATRLQCNLREASGTTISTHTIRNHLHDAGLRVRRPAVRVTLIGRHRQGTFQWCQEHVWTRADSDSVPFADEFRFCRLPWCGCNQVWRHPNERYCDAKVLKHDRYKGGSVTV